MNKKQHIGGSLTLLLSIFIAYYYFTSKLPFNLTLPQYITLIVMTPLFALLPDIDTEFGRHRATFHNIFLAITLLTLFYFYISPIIALSWAFGYLSHIILDMLTKRGVALFYPLSKRTYGHIGLKPSTLTATITTYTLMTITGTIIAYLLLLLH